MVVLKWLRRIALPTLFMVITATWPAWAATANTDVVLSNDYIAITVNARDENTGRFSIKTTGGDPDRVSDDNAHLIYRRQDQKGPWTSFTTVQIDGTAWVYGGATRDSAGIGAKYGTALERPTLQDSKQIDSAWQLGPVKATQSISIVRSSTTGLRDTARIAIELTNTDSSEHRVGLRIALDTLLGDNDGAPFRVGDHAITTDTVLAGAAIPEFWQAFDSLADPKVTAQGTLRGGEVTTPDKVYFTNWGTLTEHPWNIAIEPGRDFTREGGFDLDSAMALVWEAGRLGPGERRTFITYVGLGGLTIAPGQLRLAITSPSTVVASDAATFPIIAYVQNSGTGEARNVSATLTLPAGLRLASGQSATRNLGNLPVGATGQVRWNVAVNGGSGTLTFTVGVTAMNADTNTASRRVEVVSPAQLQVTLRMPQDRLTITSGQWDPYPYVAEATIANTGQAAAGAVTAEWASNRGLALAAGDTPLRNIGLLEPGESYTAKWHVTPIGEPGDLPYKVTASISGQASAISNGLLRVPPLETSIGMQLERQGGRSGRAVVEGETFLLRVDARNLKQMSKIAVELTYDPNYVRLIGGALGVDRGTVFVQGGSNTTQEYLGWSKPKVWIDMAKPLARVAIAGDRGQTKPELLLSGSVAVLRLQALKAGTVTVNIDKIVVQDAFGQELQISTSPYVLQITKGQ